MPRFGVSIIPSATGRSVLSSRHDGPKARGRPGLDLGPPPRCEPVVRDVDADDVDRGPNDQDPLASDVLGLPFRLPALTAKMAETLDRLSDGR